MQVGSVQGKVTSLIIQPAKAAKTSSFAYYDPADTNKDGIVSGAEALAYALTHPQLGGQRTANTTTASQSAQSASSHSWNPYSRYGTANGSARHGFLDLKA